MTACARCGRPIRATVIEPIVAAGSGSFHYECFRARAADLARDKAEQREATRAHRSELMRARHAAGGSR